MNTSAVHESVRLLPADSVAYRAHPPIFGRKTKNEPLAAHTRWAEATNDPQWAWRIAQGYQLSREPLPSSIQDETVRRAYFYLRGDRDDQMAIAHGIRTSLEYGMVRSALQGFLCARDISLEGIASQLGLDPEVVRLYEGLFFNIRNREATYGLNQLFPLTRLGAVVAAELGYNETDLTMMRAGSEHGWQDVARLAGLIPIAEADESPETMLADVEREIAANARLLARAGRLNCKDAPGIQHAKSLLLRAKQQTAAEQNTDADDRLGLGSFGMKASVLEHFRRISDPETDYRIALQRQQAMRENAKTTTE